MKYIILSVAIVISLFFTSQTSALLCTMDYTPVCGKPARICGSTDCVETSDAPIQTYSNSCMLESDGAKMLYKGECKTTDSLPKDTDTKYYVGDTNKCTIIRYGCDDGWNGFSDEIGCGCEKQKISNVEKERIDQALDAFTSRLESKGYSQQDMQEIFSMLVVRLEELKNTKPKYAPIINYLLQKFNNI